MTHATGSIGAALLALGSGGLAVGLLVAATGYLTESPADPAGRVPQPIRLTAQAPPPPERPDPRVTPSKPVPAVASKLSPVAREESTPPTRPARPRLSWARPAVATGGVGLPEWRHGTGPIGSTAPGMGRVSTRRLAEQPAFRWVHAPELRCSEALSRHYPRHAMRRGLTGEVQVAWETDAGGRVVLAQIHRADPVGVFDRNALTIVRSWRGTGQWHGLVKINFRLD